MDTQKELIAKIKKVCLCRSITAGSIMEAIRGGHFSFDALRRMIGVGTGNCKGRRCRDKVEEMVKKNREPGPGQQG